MSNFFIFLSSFLFVDLFFFLLSYTGREELLTEHALQWNRKKVERLPQSLAKRYTKV